jgi:hypothetical protein
MLLRVFLCAVIVCVAEGTLAGYADDESARDIVLLQSGGRIAGKVTELTEEDPPSVLVETADGQQLRFAKNQVKQIIRASAHIGEYLERVRNMPDTIDAHLEMAEWCKEHLESVRFANGPNELSPQRRHHLDEVLRFDPDHAQARMLLGFTRNSEGDWIHLEKVRLANGMVEHRGKWMTAEQFAILKAKQAWEDQRSEWRGKLRRLRNATQSDWAAAQAEIRKIHDPAAVLELVEALDEEKDLSWAMAYVDALGNIPPPAATGPLADRAVLHPDPSIRERCLAFLKLDGVDRAAVADRIAVYLKHPHNNVVNQAGFVLGELQQPNSILPLIDALQTKHKVANPAAGGSGQIGAGFTPNGGGGLQFGNNQPQVLNVPVPNPGVLEGLRRITGASFEYDREAWHDWYAETHTLVGIDLRRD